MCEASKNLSLTLLGEIFTAYREKVLAGCPEGCELRAKVDVGDKITIQFKRNSQWFHASDMYKSKVELLQGLVGRLTDLGWTVEYDIVRHP